MKYEKNFLKPKLVEQMIYHNISIMKPTGSPYLLLDNQLFPEANLRVDARYISNIPEEIPDYVEPHTHDSDQIFVYLSAPDEPKPLEIEFIFEDEVYNVQAPITVYVPKDVIHTQKVVKGNGWLITILKKGSYP